MRKMLQRLLGIGLLAGLAYAVWRRMPTSQGEVPDWHASPFPFPPEPVVGLDVEPDTARRWVESAGSGACPAHHPVKAKLSSGIFHVPGGANYARTNADRCYLSPEAAAADGLRAAKN